MIVYICLSNVFTHRDSDLKPEIISTRPIADDKLLNLKNVLSNIHWKSTLFKSMSSEQIDIFMYNFDWQLIAISFTIPIF